MNLYMAFVFSASAAGFRDALWVRGPESVSTSGDNHWKVFSSDMAYIVCNLDVLWRNSSV